MSFDDKVEITIFHVVMGWLSMMLVVAVLIGLTIEVRAVAARDEAQNERLSVNIDATASAVIKLHCLWGGGSEEQCDALLEEPTND